MGNYLPMRVVLDDIGDEQNEIRSSKIPENNQEKYRTSQSNTTYREEQLATIRNLNQSNKRDVERIQLKPAEGTILEEAVLEDLCGEASLELENTQTGPMTNKQKAELITKLSADPRTKKHFETADSFDLYVAKTVAGDKRTNHNLSVDYGRAMNGHLSQSIQRLETGRSHTSMLRSNTSQLSSYKMSNARSISRNDLCDQLLAHRSDMSTRSRKSQKLIANLVPQNQQTLTLDQNTGSDRKWSSATTYSLPGNFVDNRNSAMGDVDRRKTSIVCQTNEATLRMANELLEKGKINPKSDAQSEDGGFECCCIVCD
jgi:hypothetical protein